MAYPHRVELSEEQRASLRGLVGSGIAPARTLTRARILLKPHHGEGEPGWSECRNAAIYTIDWPFTTHDARIKLRRLYPAFDT